MDGENNLIEWEYMTLLHQVQLQEGLKFANKISRKHVEFHRNKMNVKIVAQVMSSVATAIEFLMTSGYPGFSGAGGTIRFIHVIDRHFDLLNSKNPFAKGYKRPLRLVDQALWMSTIESSITYLSNLKDINGTSLLTHRRKTFVLGFITAAKSTRDLAVELLNDKINPFSYLLTYKFSQDHLELLFSCIRGKNGFDNNPDIRQFKSTLKKILLRVSITGSKNANCLNVDVDDSAQTPIFSLKWTRKRTPMVESADCFGEELSVKCINDLLITDNLSLHKDAILGYIGGYVVRKILKNLSCNDNLNAYYLSLTHLKDNGGLIYPSKDVIKVIRMCELVFRGKVFVGMII